MPQTERYQDAFDEATSFQAGFIAAMKVIAAASHRPGGIRAETAAQILEPHMDQTTKPWLHWLRASGGADLQGKGLGPKQNETASIDADICNRLIAQLADMVENKV